jgi:MYND finger
MLVFSSSVITMASNPQVFETNNDYKSCGLLLYPVSCSLFTHRISTTAKIVYLDLVQPRIEFESHCCMRSSISLSTMAQNVRDVKALVEEFNNLSIEGSWCIGIVPIFGNGHYIFALNDSCYRNAKGRTPIVYVSDDSDPVKLANVIVPYFLELFVSCFDVDELRIHGYSGRVAPQTWALINSAPIYPELAATIQAELGTLGVREDLCVVEMDNSQWEDTYLWHLKGMTQSVVTKRSRETNSRLHPGYPELASGGHPPVFCANCENSISYFFRPLRLCGGCVETWYCDRSCQREDWDTHRDICYESLSTFGQSRSTLVEISVDWQDMPYLINVEEDYDSKETDSYQEMDTDMAKWRD